jgi:CBS domain-containing protein
MRNGAVEGIISERDLGGKRGLGARSEQPVSEVMEKHVLTGEPDMSIKRAANLMRGHVIGCLPVIEKGKLKGILTVSDLLDVLGRGAEKPTARTDRAILSRRQGRRQKGH